MLQEKDSKKNVQRLDTWLRLIEEYCRFIRRKTIRSFETVITMVSFTNWYKPKQSDVNSFNYWQKQPHGDVHSENKILWKVLQTSRGNTCDGVLF